MARWRSRCGPPKRWRLPPALLLDCTCGIGTQALPLAALGFDVTGTDVSPRMIERGRSEAVQRNIAVRLDVADVRTVADHVQERFHAVISCENALPHVLTDQDLAAALSSVAACLLPGGLFLATIRDYDVLRGEAPAGVPISVHGIVGSRHASGQAWTWTSDREFLATTLFTLEEQGASWRGSSHETTYRALSRGVLTSALEAAGFEHVTWHSVADTGYYQPVVDSSTSAVTHQVRLVVATHRSRLPVAGGRGQREEVISPPWASRASASWCRRRAATTGTYALPWSCS